MQRITMKATMVLAIAGSAALAQTQPTNAERLAELRADYAKLKLEHDEAMAELDELRSALRHHAVAADPAAPAAETPSAETARPTLTDAEAAALLKRIADHQATLEAQVDTLIARQREVEQQVSETRAAQQPADAAAYRQSIDSPYAYRYERTEQRIVRNPAATVDKPVIVSPKYTVYSGGYTTDAYVLPVKPRRTVAAPVYINNHRIYHHAYHPRSYGYYGGHHRTSYHNSRYYRPNGLTVGVHHGKGFFKYSTGGHHRSGYHHR